MKFFCQRLILALMTATILVACKNGQQTSNPADLMKPQVTGTGDSGGGNTYKGRPLESYISNIQKLPSFQTHIAPILKALTIETPGSMGEQKTHYDLGRMFQFVVNKSWYMIPGELETLSREQIGSAVPTEQAALQSFDKIWINSLIFEAMSTEDQARLILHEILMGVRLLKFESSYGQCLAYAPDINYCQSNSKSRNGSSHQLSDKDYEDIRSTVVTIMQSFESFTHADWEHLMATRDFSLPTYPFRMKGDTGKISRDVFLKNLETSVITGHLPKFGYSEFTEARTVAKEKCQVQFENIDQPSEFKLKVSSPSAEYKIDWDLSNISELYFNRSNHIGSQKQTSISMRQKLDAKKGERYLTVDFFFDFDRLTGVEIRELICTDVKNESNGNQYCSSAATPADPQYYLCFDQAEIVFQ